MSYVEVAATSIAVISLISVVYSHAILKKTNSNKIQEIKRCTNWNEMKVRKCHNLVV